MSNITYKTRDEEQCEIKTVMWTIPNFCNLLDTNIQEIRTDKATRNTDEESHPFQLKLLFIGHNNDLIEVYYCSPKSLFMKTTLNICLKGFVERSITVKDFQTIPVHKWQVLASLPRTHFTDNADSYLLSDGSFRLKFELYLNKDIKDTSIPCQLSKDFGKLLKDELFSDMSIKSIDGKEYKVHKAMVATRSEVLKAHFEHNTIESITNIVESPLDSELLQEVLTFIYTNEAPRVDEFPGPLLAAANFYQLTGLKDLCGESLHKQLTIDNAIETLQLAELHSASKLKQLTMDFIKDGQAKLIIHTDAWAKFESLELIKTLYEHIMDDNLDSDIK